MKAPAIKAVIQLPDRLPPLTDNFKQGKFMTSFIRNFLASSALLGAMVAFPVTAQESAPDCALRIASGPKGKVYELIAKDIQAVCGSSVSVCSTPSTGGLQNLMLLSSNDAELGIVQLNTLEEMSKGGDDNIKNLQAVMPLHTNLLHILSLRAGSSVRATSFPFMGNDRNIQKFTDLKGLKVAVVGSTQLLGQVLNKHFGHGMELLIADSDDHALKMLNSNQVQAIFSDGGWPLPSVARHRADSGLQLVEFDVPAPDRFTVVQRSYEKLDAFNRKFLGTPNLLVTRAFKPGGETGKKVSALQSCLLKNIDELQEGRYQSCLLYTSPSPRDH
jgi:TRAP-type uncharacterized transport system substrate-binding protein